LRQWLADSNPVLLFGSGKPARRRYRRHHHIDLDSPFWWTVVIIKGALIGAMVLAWLAYSAVWVIVALAVLAIDAVREVIQSEDS
jgi:hypothetical protein